MQTPHYQPQYPPPSSFAHYPPTSASQGYTPSVMHDHRFPQSLVIPHSGHSNKRYAPPHPHRMESPAKKKQTKWSQDEDASIIELRGNGMKWEDISKHLPGRSAISCRLRFQNYLERRSEWDEERKNKLARLYERFKKDMWEKIAKDMQLPWRAAEAMHWQIGEVELAQRANVPVFHLAGQQVPVSAAMGPNVPPDVRGASTSPSAGSAPPSTLAYASHTHNHSLPAISHPFSPEQSQRSGRSSPGGLRRRADSARSVVQPPPIHAHMVNLRTLLPPLVDITVPPNATVYRLPPVVTSEEMARR